MRQDLLRDMISNRCKLNPDGIAISAPGMDSLTYNGLTEQLDRTHDALANLGLQAGGRVALSIDNGPWAATAFLSLSSWGSCAPLNPVYREKECAWYLEDLAPEALVTGDIHSPAAHVARDLSVPVLELVCDPAVAAGEFELRMDSGSKAVGTPSTDLSSGSRPSRPALLLHTSGTTARPKVVPLSAENLIASARHIATSLQLSPTDVCLNVMPLFHIHGLIGALLASIQSGASVVCTPGFHAPHFFDWLVDCSPTWYTAVPTMHQAVLARSQHETDALRRTQLRFIRSSSAALPPQVAEQLETVFDTPVIESYGMTEASHQMASNPLPPGKRKPGSVGPAAGPMIAVMDEHGNTLTQGQTGEVVIRGPNVMAGYEATREVNDRAFHTDWFRTGDQGYLDSDGYLFLTGRIKELINRGGEKIAPREIDEALLSHPAVEQAVSFAIPDDKLGEEVGAAVVLTQQAQQMGRVVERDLQEHTARLLADFKVPRLIRFLEQLPKGPTGKLKRVGLAKVLGIERVFTSTESDDHQQALPPNAGLEADLASIWSEVLGIEQVNRDSRFFDVGGDSVLGVMVLARIRDRWKRDLAPMELYKNPSLSQLAEAVDSAPDITEPLTASDELTLSTAQERMAYLWRLEADPRVTNRSMCIDVEGQFTGEALEHALTRIIDRHLPLRSYYPFVQGKSTLGVHSLDRPLSLEVVDLSQLPADEREVQLVQQCRQFSCRPLIIDRARPIQVVWFRRSPDSHTVLLLTHHAACDETSEQIISRELASLLAGQEPSSLTSSYSDVAHWQRSQLTSERTQELRSYWKERLRELAPLLPLPYDATRPSVQTYDGVHAKAKVPLPLAQRLRRLASENNTTLFNVVLCAYRCLLSRYCGVTDVAVGTPVSGRSHLETENLVGLFTNTVVLRAGLDGDPLFTELLRQSAELLAEDLRHQDLPFDQVVEELEPDRSLSHGPLTNVWLQVRQHRRPHKAGTFEAQPRVFEREVALFDLSLEWRTADDGDEIVLNANRALFKETTISKMLESFVDLLEGVTADPETPISRLMVPTHSQLRSFPGWQSTIALDGQQWPLVELERWASSCPDEPAVEDETRSLTYGQLWRQVENAAATLRARGVASEVAVGIVGPRSIESIISILACLHAGGVCVPVDPTLPVARLQFMLEDAGIRLLVRCPLQTTLDLETKLPVVEFDALVEASPRTSQHDWSTPPNSLAYLLYTSGSTGRPKAVGFTRSGLQNLVNWQLHPTRWLDQPRTLQFASLSFDVAFQELLATLASQGTLVFAPEKYRGSPRELWDFIIARRVNTLFVPSVMLDQLCVAANRSGKRSDLRVIFTAGDRLQVSPDLRAFFCDQGGIRLVNQYGPTEAHVVTSYCLQGDVSTWPSLPPIGKPISNVILRVLDDQLQAVPQGAVGELYIGGVALARGYAGRPARTATSFIADPYGQAGDRLYRTGDLVRWNWSTELEFIGRVDAQLKIRGYRVEPGEIQAVLLQHDHVAQAAVVLRDGRLIAFVVAESGTALDSSAMRHYLAARLPDYMLPDIVQLIPAMPVNRNGKVDTVALPAPQPTTRDVVEHPQGGLENTIANVWQRVLQLDGVGRNDNFFDIGGHSFSLLQVLAELEAELDRELSATTLFQYPTIASLAVHLNNASDTGLRSQVSGRAARQHNALRKLARRKHGN